MRRCPDCGFRTEDKICPLCGVRTKPGTEPPTHVHEPGETCTLMPRPAELRETAREPVRQKKTKNRFVQILLGFIYLFLLSFFLQTCASILF